jgi:hypothetical protein
MKLFVGARLNMGALSEMGFKKRISTSLISMQSVCIAYWQMTGNNKSIKSDVTFTINVQKVQKMYPKHSKQQKIFGETFREFY